MTVDPKTILNEIECLARLTGAPQSFVMQVKGLFSNKGISLDSDAGPYVDALEEAFRREERIRQTSQRARENLSRVGENFRRVGRAYTQRLKQLKRPGRQVREGGKTTPGADSENESRAIPISKDHRAYVTRQQSDTYPMVPGPKDLQ
jgi:hypothetical protein